MSFVGANNYRDNVTDFWLRDCSSLEEKVFRVEKYRKQLYCQNPDKWHIFALLIGMIENDEDIELDDYLENIIALGEYNGELYELIPSFNAVTLIGKTSDVGEGFSWTFDDVNKLLEEKGEDVSLFSKDSISRSSVMYYGISMAFDQFYNSNTGECNFDSKEFIQFLELLKQFPETGPDVWMDDNY